MYSTAQKLESKILISGDIVHYLFYVAARVILGTPRRH
jgi:hypothetical protein